MEPQEAAEILVSNDCAHDQKLFISSSKVHAFMSFSYLVVHWFSIEDIVMNRPTLDLRSLRNIGNGTK